MSVMVQDTVIVPGKTNSKSCMAYRMTRLPMTLSEAEGHFCCFKHCNTHNSESRPMACFNYTMCLYINGKRTWVLSKMKNFWTS